MIEVKNLVKRYGDRNVVDHLSFTVEKGQIVGKVVLRAWPLAHVGMLH